MAIPPDLNELLSNTSIRATQTSLRDVNRLLKLDPSNTNLLAQKQKLLKQAISDTKTKLDSLKEAQKQAKEQMERGELGGRPCRRTW